MYCKHSSLTLGMHTYYMYMQYLTTGLPEYSGGGNDVVEHWVEGIAVLDTAIIGCSSIYHHHHCSTHWRVRGCEFHSNAVDAGSIDTGSAEE